MYREAYEQLKSWKETDGRKPLIVRGARQVDETWLLKEFARAKEFKLAIQWLVNAGLVYKSCRVSKPEVILNRNK